MNNKISTKRVLRLLKIISVQKKYKVLSSVDKQKKIYTRIARLEMISLEFFISTHTIEDYISFDVEKMISELGDGEKILFDQLLKKQLC